jgi:hypothetical protein
MSSQKPLDQSSRVAAEEGEVLVEGPNGIALSLTPEAAETTSRRLLDGAARAAGQKTSGRRRARGRSGP